MQRRISCGTLNALKARKVIIELIPLTVPLTQEVDARIDTEKVLEIPLNSRPEPIDSLASYFT